MRVYTNNSHDITEFPNIGWAISLVFCLYVVWMATIKAYFSKEISLEEQVCHIKSTIYLPNQGIKKGLDQACFDAWGESWLVHWTSLTNNQTH